MKNAVWLCCILLLAAACSAERPPLSASSVRLAAPMPGMDMGAAYLELENNSTQDIRITRVTSPQLDRVAQNESILENDISRMVRLAEVLIPAGESLIFAPGAKHLMVRYPANRTTPVTLNFFADSDLLLSVSADFQD